MLTHGSLFSGIGGFDLAASWMEWTNVFHCEQNLFGRRVLKYYWPQAKSYEDIKNTNFSIHRGTIDIITGGFPCQPYSNAGKRKGKNDDRHLWPEMLRAIREIQPSWVVGENVSGLLSWSKGLVFEEVQTDLEAEGYEVQAFLLPACGVGAPHQRERVWIIAHDSNKEHGRQKEGVGESNNRRFPTTKQKGVFQGEKHKHFGFNNLSNATKTITNTTSRGGIQNNGQRESKLLNQGSQENYWDYFPTQLPICGGNDGLSNQLDRITIHSRGKRRTLNEQKAFNRWRKESIQAYGNAIVPQVAYQIFKAIQEYESITKRQDI